MYMLFGDMYEIFCNVLTFTQI